MTFVTAFSNIQAYSPNKRHTTDILERIESPHSQKVIVFEIASGVHDGFNFTVRILDACVCDFTIVKITSASIEAPSRKI